jgi:protein-tyrosine-phosphatase
VSLTGGGRAQIGAAMLSRAVGDAVNVHCAGSDFSGDIDENVRAVLGEVGVDLAGAYVRFLTSEVLAGADIVVMMGRSVGEVAIPQSVRHIDWRVGDPSGASLDEVRRVCEDIDRRVAELTKELSAPMPRAVR